MSSYSSKIEILYLHESRLQYLCLFVLDLMTCTFVEVS